MDKKFGNRLVHAMEIRNMKQKELAKATGVTEATVSRYVNEKRRPDIDFIRDIVRVLNVSADYLLGFTNDMTPGGGKHKSLRISLDQLDAKYILISNDTGDVIAIQDQEQIEALDHFFTLVK